MLTSLRSSLPPNSTSFVGGRPRDDFSTQVRFRAPSCNSLPISKFLVAKRQRGVGARGKPPNLGVATQRSKERGACSALCETCIESSPTRTANHEPKREFAPYHAKQVMGGSKRAVSPSLWHGGSKKTQWFTMAGAVCGGRPNAKREKARPTAKRHSKECPQGSIG
jgi:hypothetical protein